MCPGKFRSLPSRSGLSKTFELGIRLTLDAQRNSSRTCCGLMVCIRASRCSASLVLLFSFVATRIFQAIFSGTGPLHSRGLSGASAALSDGAVHHCCRVGERTDRGSRREEAAPASRSRSLAMNC